MEAEAIGIIFVVLIVRVIFGAVAAAIASAKGRSAVGWFFGGFFIDIIAIIIVAVLPNLKEEAARRDYADRENRRLREQLRQERLKTESFRQHATARLDVHDQHMGLDTRNAGMALGAGEQAQALLGSADDLEMLEPVGEEALVSQSAQPRAGASRMWHYESAGEARGPVTERQLLDMLRCGHLGRSTLLWTEDLPDWKAAQDIRALQPYLPV